MDQDPHSEIQDMAEGAIVSLLDTHWPEKSDPEPEALLDLAKAFTAQFGVDFDGGKEPFIVDGRPAKDRARLGGLVLDAVNAVLEEKKGRCDAFATQYAAEGYPDFSSCERQIVLQILDAQWKDHLHTMDGLRAGINMRAYGQRDPKLEYQREGFALFDDMLARIEAQTLELVFKFALPPTPDEQPRPAARLPVAGPPPEASPPAARPGVAGGSRTPTKVEKVGRNDPCPCGSGKKYKKCHGVA
jgi:preprotein translocase subunit SecA